MRDEVNEIVVSAVTIWEIAIKRAIGKLRFPQPSRGGPYDSVWPERYVAERAHLVRAAGDLILELEHIGSTAVPGLRSKPIIDMMAAVRDLRQGQDLAQLLSVLGYELIETGM